MDAMRAPAIAEQDREHSAAIPAVGDMLGWAQGSHFRTTQPLIHTTTPAFASRLTDR